MKPTRLPIASPASSALVTFRILTARLALILLASQLVLPPVVHAQPTNVVKQKVDLLFVQNGTGVAFDLQKGTLRLKNVSPSTLFFSDRPVRLAGHLHTEKEFLSMWGETDDSFVKDPPNATVSIVEAGRQDLQNVVVKLQKPRMDGKDIVYNITVLDGVPPKAGGAAAIFIDVLGFWRFGPRVAVIDPVPVIAPVAVMDPVPVVTTVNVAPLSTPPASLLAPAPVAAPASATPPPAAAKPAPVKPALPPAEQKLAELKSMLSQGFITQAQYDQASQKVINEMIQQ